MACGLALAACAPVDPYGAPFRTSSDAFEAQAARDGWDASACPDAPGGVREGDVLADLEVVDCEGNARRLADTCGAAATWVFFAHAWCPTCQRGAGIAEGVWTRFADRGVAALHVLVENPDAEPPGSLDCRAWRDTHGHDRVVTLFAADPEAALAFFEQDATALNLFVDAERRITGKVHSADEATIVAGIRGALSP